MGTTRRFSGCQTLRGIWRSVSRNWRAHSAQVKVSAWARRLDPVPDRHRHLALLIPIDCDYRTAFCRRETTSGVG